MQRIVEQAKLWADNNAHVSILNLQYEQGLNKPEEAAIKIEKFLALGLNVSEMAAAVDASLWNEKGDKLYLKTDRSPLAIAKLVHEYTADKIYCEIGIGERHNLNLIKTPKRLVLRWYKRLSLS